MIPTFIRSYVAAAAVLGNRIVKYAAPSTDKTVNTATASTQPFVGVSDRLGADAGQMLDVHRGGLVAVQLGGTVTAGAPLTSDDEGKAVAATATAGSTIRVIGYADEPGVEDDIIDVMWAPGLLHEASA